MTIPTIVFLDRATFAAHLHLALPQLQHHWLAYEQISKEEIPRLLGEAEVLVTNKVHLRAELLSQLPNLRLISLTATGFDNVDIDYCSKAGIAVTNIRNYATATLAEHTLGLLLMLARSLVNYHQSVIDGHWSERGQFSYFDYPIRDLTGRTLCIMGKGSTGSRVASLAKSFGMKVVFAEHKNATDVRDGYMPFYQALELADVISLHCPLNRHTASLLGVKEFSVMQRKPLVINTSRGGLINEDALIDALRQRQISGAAIDVIPQEPPPKNSRLIAAGTEFPNLVITPHIAWASDDGQLAAWQQAMENIEAFYRGENVRRLV